MATKTEPRIRLTAKQEAFCVNYVILRNATQAAIKAGYSPRTAAVSASENLNKPYVVARKNELEERIASAKLLPEKERREILAKIARETHFLPVTARDRIVSIAELNKMDNIYTDTPPQGGDTINNFVFILPNGTKITPGALIEGQKVETTIP